ncbi:diguanylate cyclase [Marinobacter sp. 1Y8]
MATAPQSAMWRILTQGWPVLASLVAGFVLTAILALRADEVERQVVEARFEQEARSRILLIEELLQAQLRELDTVRRFITLNPDLTKDEFDQMVRLSGRLEMTIAWIENIPSTQLDPYLDRMRLFYGPGFHLRLPPAVESLSSGDIRRHFPISFVNSSAPQPGIEGVDVSYLPRRVAAYENAMALGSAVVISDVRTLDDPGQSSGLLVFAPVFTGGTVQDITDHHFGNLRGFVGLGLRLINLADVASAAQVGGHAFNFSFVDTTDPDAVQTLFSGNGDGGGSGLLFGRDMNVADRVLQVTAVPMNPSDWERRPTALVVFVSGGVLSVLVAGYIALVLLQRSRAQRMVASKTGELQSTLRALSESEARWQFALEGSGDGVWDWDLRTNEVYFSDGWKALLGYSSDEIGSDISEWTSRKHPDDTHSSQDSLEEHLRGDSPYYEDVHRLLCKNGRYKWILDRGKVVEWLAPGQPARVIGTHSDIDDVKRTELALREVNGFLSGLLASAEDVSIIATDPLGTITLFNRGAERLLGYDAKEVIGRMTPVDFHLPSEMTTWEATLSRQTGRSVQGMGVLAACVARPDLRAGRWTYLCKNGEQRQVRLTLSSIRDDSGLHLGYLAVGLDMTAYLEAVAALERSDKLFQELTASVPGMIYQYMLKPDGSGRFLYVSNGVRHLLEMTQEEAQASAAQVFSRIHPADEKLLHSSVQLSAETMERWLCEFRVSLPRHGERWLRGEAIPRRLDDGSILWYGYLSDITEIKKLEFGLRQEATVDPLTGAFNRRHLESHWDRDMARFHRKQVPFSIVMLDIDHFKRINDSHGHAVGDEVLVRLGRLLSDEVRSTDVVYRLGGEEFLILCEDTVADGALSLAQNLLECIRQMPLPFSGHMTASFGVVEVRLDESREDAFKRLDTLLYAAKSGGRNQVVSAPTEPSVS